MPDIIRGLLIMMLSFVSELQGMRGVRKTGSRGGEEGGAGGAGADIDGEICRHRDPRSMTSGLGVEEGGHGGTLRPLAALGDGCQVVRWWEMGPICLGSCFTGFLRG